MNHKWSIIIFVSIVLTTMHLDGALRNFGNALRRASGCSIALIQRPVAGMPINFQRFSHEQKYVQSRPFGSGVRLFSGKATCVSPGDIDEVDEDGDEVLFNVLDTWAYIEILKGPVESYSHEKIKQMISRVKQAMLFKEWGEGLAKEVYTYLYHYILQYQGVRYAIHPELLIMLLSINHHHIVGSLMELAIVERIEHMKEQELDRVVKQLYENLVSEITTCEMNTHDDKNKKVIRQIYTEAQWLAQWIEALMNACRKVNIQLQIGDEKLKELHKQLDEINNKLQKTLKKIEQYLVQN